MDLIPLRARTTQSGIEYYSTHDVREEIPVEGLLSGPRFIRFFGGRKDISIEDDANVLNRVNERKGLPEINAYIESPDPIDVGPNIYGAVVIFCRISDDKRTEIKEARRAQIPA